MKLWVGITDSDWFRFCSERKPDEVNFWQPSGEQSFKALQPGGLFLFKLHSPDNFIVGGGFFIRFTFLPARLAWEAFGEKNGVLSFSELIQRIRKYRRDDSEANPTIGCSILTEPFYWPRDRWIPIPASWGKSIVRGKTYDSEHDEGRQLFHEVHARLAEAQRPNEQMVVRELDAPPLYGPCFRNVSEAI